MADRNTHSVIDGELVWRTLQANGAPHVDVVFVSDLSPAQLKALRLMLNRSAEDANWDDQHLKVVFQALIDLKVDLELTGFDPNEIDVCLDRDLPKSNVEENGADIPPVEERAIFCSGNVWALHRIGCGNATDLAFVRKVLASSVADVCFIDPPYNIPLDGLISGKGRNKHREFLGILGRRRASCQRTHALRCSAMHCSCCSHVAPHRRSSRARRLLRYRSTFSPKRASMAERREFGMDGPVITQSVLLCLRELRERLTKAQQVAKAAEACAAAGSLSEAVTLALDIEHPLYEATRLSDATLLLGRLVKE